jgi:hypothetical protein
MRKVEAYKTYTTKLYNYSDPRLGGDRVVYGSPYKQWAYDKSITGLTIPTGFTIDGNFTATGTSGMMIDFDNGRIIFNSGVSTGLNITGTYSVKEINSYITDQPEDNLIIEGKYITNSRFTVTETNISPYNPVTPCAFVSIENMDNNGFALGGEDETRVTIKAVIFAENLYQLDGVLSTFADTYNTNFNIIPMTNHPLGEYNNLKTGLYPTGYNYITTNAQYTANKCYIYDVTTSKMKDDVLKELNPTLHIGFIDFNIGNIRYPRQ